MYAFNFLLGVIAITIPQLDNFMALVGSLSGAAVALVLPPILHTLCFWNEGLTNRELHINILITIVGIVGSAAGTISAIFAIVHRFQEYPHSTRPTKV